jgi:hypothetical protein
MPQTHHDVMSKEFLEYDLEDAIGILQDGMTVFRAALQIEINLHHLDLEAANSRLRILRRELVWLKAYRKALVLCPFYTLDDVRSQLRRSLNRLRPVLEF